MTQSNRETVLAMLYGCSELLTGEVQKDYQHYNHCQSSEKRELLLKEFLDNYPEFITSVDEIFKFLEENFPMPEMTDDDKIEFNAEIKKVLHGQYPNDPSGENIPERCFPIWIMRGAMSGFKIPMGISPEWKSFTKVYGNYIMDA